MDEHTPLWIFRMTDGTTQIARLAGDALADWQLDRCMAQHYAEENERLRNELRYRQILEKYNRAHGQNKKITLKQICEREGASYDAVRQFRSREQRRKKAK